MSKSRDVLILAALAGALLATPALAGKLGLGREALPEEVAAWDVAVLPDGTGLRPGSGDVATGDEVFAEKCAACHGEFAEGLDSWPVLAGGGGTLTDRRPVKTVGSYWPYLSTVWDYVHRSMPFGAAQTLSVDETYAITAFLLYSNGLVDDDFVLSDENFREIELPNTGGFYPDDRPQSEYPLFSGEPCMSDCRQPAAITKRAVELNVTPEDPDGRPAGTLPPLWDAAALPASAPSEAAPASETAAETEVAAAPAATEPAPAAEPAAADPAADPALIAEGAGVFKKCAACHKVGEGAKHAVGPALNGVVGAPVGAADGFKYSKVMVEAGAGGMVWDAETLHAYLADPKGFLPKNKMAFVGLKKDRDRDAVIAYLTSLGK